MADNRSVTALDVEMTSALGVLGRNEVLMLRGLLRARVPITLLMDLVSPEGPDSSALMESERGRRA